MTGLTALLPQNPDRQVDRSQFDFVRFGRSFEDQSTNDLSLRLLEIAVELGLPDDLPVPPKGVPGFNRRPEMDVMWVIRAGVAYALALAGGEHRECWLRYEEIEAALRREWHKGADHERQALADRNAEYARRQSAEATKKIREALVYFIGSEAGAVKIGMAVDPEKRMRSLQTSHHSPLRLLATTDGGQERERAYHAQFAEHRLNGEWFSPHPDILAEIERLAGL